MIDTVKLTSGYFKSFVCLSCILLLTFTNIFKPIHAQESTKYIAIKKSLLQELIDELKTKHPLLKELQYKIKAQEHRSVYERMPPNPKFGFELKTNEYPFNLDSIGDLPNNYAGFALSQEVVIPGKLKYRGKMELAEVAKLKNELALSELILVAKLKQDFYELYFVDQSLRVYKKIKDLLITLENTVSINYQVGKGTQYDLLRVQLEKSKVIEQIEALLKDRKVFVAGINNLVLREPLSELEPDYWDIDLTPLPFNEIAAIEMAKANYPQLMAQNSVIEKSLNAVKLAKREYIPNFTLNGFYGFRGNNTEELSTKVDPGGLFAVGIETTLPIFFKWKESKVHKEAEETLKSEEEEYKNLELDTQFQTEKIYTIIDKSNVLADLLRTGIVPQASLTTDSAIATYKVGKTDFPFVIDSIKDLLNYEIEYYTHVTTGLINKANLEPLIGTSLDHVEDVNEDEVL